MVTAEGDRGVAVRTHHTVELKVEQLFDRGRAEEGRLEVQVNDIWGGDAVAEWHSPRAKLARAGRPQPYRQHRGQQLPDAEA